MDIMAGNMVNMASEASETNTSDNVRFAGGYSGFYPSTFLCRLPDLETQSGIEL